MRPVAFQTVTLRRKKGERGLEEAPHLLRPRMPPTLRFVNRRMIYLVFWTETERNHASLHLVGTIAASQALLLQLRFEQDLSLEEIARMCGLGDAPRVHRKLALVLKKLRCGMD